jgi:type II secretory pathway component PulJ
MSRSRAFTLIELLVAIAITMLLVVLLATIGDSASRAWQRGAAQAESYSTARGSINTLGRELGSAVIDLDMGFIVEPVTGEPGNFIIKFLRRREPTADGDVVEKTAYQLGWATRNLLPEVQAHFDAEHSVPVLIRTSSTDLADVYSGQIDGWARDWGTLSGPTQTGVRGGSDGQTVVEIAAENVVGWKIVPKFWDGTQFQNDTLDAYYGKYLTSDKAPGSLEVGMAILPSRSVPALSQMAEWGQMRSRNDLFDYTALGTSVLESGLRQHLRHFTTTLFLSSRTP